jgi:transketolase
MRKQFDQVLTDLASRDSSIFLIVADLGNFKIFKKNFPDRLINVGVAEANSINIAAGLASEGNKVFVYSVAGFSLYRGFEQLKYSVGYWNQKVYLVGTGFGWKYYRIGRGHHAPDDIAVASLIPNLRIVVPIDVLNIEKLFLENQDHPIYLRLGRGIDLNDAKRIPHLGKDLVVIALGEIKKRCTKPIVELRKEGYDIGLIGVEDLSYVKLKQKLLSLSSNSKIFVIEDHIAMGGLGYRIQRLGYKLLDHVHIPISIEAVFEAEREFLKFYGFDHQAIKKRIKKNL